MPKALLQISDDEKLDFPQYSDVLLYENPLMWFILPFYIYACVKKKNVETGSDVDPGLSVFRN